jgi:Ran GTPase-activating protein 1
MVFEIAAATRADLVGRMDDHLAAMGFHYFGQTIANSKAKAEEIEARAFAVAEVASNTTTESWSAGTGGGHATIQLIRLYVKKAAELLKDEAARCGEAMDATPGAAGADGAGESQDSFDLSSKDREFYTQQRTEQVMAPLLAKGATFSKVKLSTKSFGIDAAKVVTKAFANIASTLKEVDLSDIIAGRPEEEAMKAMQIITEATLCANITHVDVSDNAFGEKGVRACSKMLQQQTGIESISFINNGISEQAAAAILELLASPQSLKKFHLDKNMTGDEGTVHVAALLARAPGMEDFKMAGSRFTSAGAVMLAKGLATGTSLARLDLTDNNVNEEGGIALAGMLFKQPGIRHLNFEATSLGPDAAAAVASALAAGCPQLEYLNLGCCDITPEGVPALAQAVSAMKNLRVLKIAENELGDFGVLQICMALKHSGCPLVELDVSTNELVQAGAVAAATLAASKPGFACLNLDANYISDEGVDEVRAVLEGAGISSALMPMEENDADMADEADEDQANGLNARLDQLKI